MARNGSGTYAKINTFSDGATITAAGHNQNWDDLVTEMTNSVAADGQTSMTGPLKASNGSAASPSVTFASDTNTGVYRIGADNLGISVGGTKIVDVASTGATVTGTLTATSFSGTHTLTDVNITGGTALTAPAVDDELPVYDLSATANRKIQLQNLWKIINALTAETSPATDDVLAMYDTSEGAANSMTFANFLKVLNALTEDTSPDGSADFLLSYDTSASANKKVKPSSLGAAQSDQETATSTSLFVTPAVQHNHPSAIKFWAFATVSGGVPTLVSSYNVTSITDTSLGRMTVTIATDFSSANWCGQVSVESGHGANCCGFIGGSRSAGAIDVWMYNTASGLAADPNAWHVMGMGDQ